MWYFTTQQLSSTHLGTYLKSYSREENNMTRVTYIVTPKNKKEQPFEVKTLKDAVTATNNRTTGDYKVKYTRVEEEL
jgi:hypothetical protein